MTDTIGGILCLILIVAFLCVPYGNNDNWPRRSWRL